MDVHHGHAQPHDNLVGPFASVRHGACGVEGPMNALRGLSAVIARWRLRWITKRRLREMLRRDDIIRAGAPRLAVAFAAGCSPTTARLAPTSRELVGKSGIVCIVCNEGFSAEARFKHGF